MIHKEFIEKYNFYKVTCDEGEVISKWNVGDDILEYSSFTIAYCPQNADLSVYHTFTIEENEEFKRLQEEERKKHEPVAFGPAGEAE